MNDTFTSLEDLIRQAIARMQELKQELRGGVTKSAEYLRLKKVVEISQAIRKRGKPC